VSETVHCAVHGDFDVDPSGGVGDWGTTAPQLPGVEAVEAFAFARHEVRRRSFLLDGDPLVAPGVVAVARTALSRAVGPRVGSTTWTVWKSLVQSRNGVRRTEPWLAYAEWHFEQTSKLFSKGSGPTYNPTTNADGHRANASTLFMHQLVLDCDGTGDWFELRQALGELRLACLMHRSGGHTQDQPKWRVVFPLAQPFLAEGRDRKLAWSHTYEAARTVFGAVAKLAGVGFDPSTDGPFHPWYPGYRRTAAARPCEVVLADGATLDLDRLLEALPPRWQPQTRRHRATVRKRENWASGPTPLNELARAFDRAGFLGRDLGGKFAVRCPWNHCHTEPLSDEAEPTSSTVVFADGDRWGTFYCSHAHCGARTAREVLAALPPEAVTTLPRSPNPPHPPWSRIASLPRELRGLPGLRGLRSL
jgi:hypothetical protein